MNEVGKRRQDYLLQLIHALNPNERRYFKLFSNIQPGEKRYLRLFELLENKTEYKASELSKELGITLTQLADEKYYLNQVILRSLRNFDDEAQSVNSIYNSLAEARSLFNRRLYDYALLQIEKLLKRVNYLELYGVTLDIALLKQACLRRLSKFEELRALTKENQILRRRYSELFEMTQLSFAITNLEQKRGKMDEAKKLFANPVFKRKPEGLRTFIVWFNLKAYQQILMADDPVKWVKFARESVDYCAKKPQLLEINPLGYLYMYTDLATAYIGIGNFEAAIKVIRDFLNLLKKPVPSAPKGEIESARIFALYLYVHALRQVKRYTEAHKMAIEVYENRHLRSLYDQFSFTFELALVLLHLGLTTQALDKINELLQIKADVRLDYQPVLRVLLIMAQVDSGNFGLVPYLIKSAKIWLKRKKIANKEYALFFSLIANVAKADPNQQCRDAYRKLSQVILNNQLHELDKEIDLIGWTEKHLKNA